MATEVRVKDAWKVEVEQGKRFAFGENWTRFLATLDDERITIAEQSLREMLGVEQLTGKSFLDIGSGSGLFSLVARRLGARVYSFDYDPQSVACTAELRRRYFPDDEQWTATIKGKSRSKSALTNEKEAATQKPAAKEDPR